MPAIANGSPSAGDAVSSVGTSASSSNYRADRDRDRARERERDRERVPRFRMHVGDTPPPPPGRARTQSPRQRLQLPPGPAVPPSDDVWATEVGDLRRRLRMSETQVQRMQTRHAQSLDDMVGREQTMQAFVAVMSQEARTEINSP